jgi:hypothetical protein
VPGAELWSGALPPEGTDVKVTATIDSTTAARTPSQTVCAGEVAHERPAGGLYHVDEGLNQDTVNSRAGASDIGVRLAGQKMI